MNPEKFERLEIASAAALEAWLSARHDQPDSVWLVTYKKSSPEKYVSREAVLDALIAWGWIDGVRKKLDDERTMQLISPRKQQVWARTYQERAARLEAEGRMRAPGAAAIAAAKRSGLWNASSAVDSLEIPGDVATALAGAPAAQSAFEATAPSYRRNVLRWIASAKRPDTRARRIAKLVDACAAGERIKSF